MQSITINNLPKISTNKKPFIWNSENISFLKLNYPTQGKMWCANQLGTGESSIRYKAASLRLTIDYNSQFFKNRAAKSADTVRGRKRPDQSLVMKNLWENGKITKPKKKIRVCPVCSKDFVREDQKNHRKTCSNACSTFEKINRWKIKPHPKGMIGKTHSNELKQKMSERTKNMWKNKDSKYNSIESSIKRSQRNSILHEKGILGGVSAYSNCKRGWLEIGDKKYFMRSKWEINYARYLNFLVDKKEIKDWEYEVDIFRFEKIKQGVVSYKPDFKIHNNDDSIEYHEVKGWMDAKSKTKLKRMAKYYPKIKLILVDQKVYKSIAKYQSLIKGWE